MSMISENSDRIVPPSSIDSPYADESCNVEVMNLGGNVPLKKGPWTSAEDAILVEYVTKHGEGNWNSVQKHSGLARCGKSCRLRWANHLRPDLKKGAFTPEEERRIIELHAKMGNKWARMAAELPGRTDNEIKNYWNTRIKRQQRAGLPIYPPDISLQALTESNNGNMSAYSDDNPDHPDFSPINGIDIIPTVEFKSYEFNQRFYASPPPLDIPTHVISNETLLSAVYPTKRLRQSDSLFLNSSDGFSHGFTGCVSNYDVQSFGMCSDIYDENLTPPDNVLPVGYAQLNGNSNGTTATTSSSEPITWATKLELPSLQTPMGSRWSLPSSSPPTHSSGILSTRNSGLLDAVLQESKYLMVLKNNNDNLGPDTHVNPVEEEEPVLDLHETEEWQPFHDLNSHFDYSDAPSMFNTIYTPVGESSLVEEPSSFHTIEGNKVQQEDGIATEYDGKVSIDLLFSKPDLVLASN